MKRKNIAIIGTGGVGGYFACKFLKNAAAQSSVTLIARGAHYEQIRTHGLQLVSPESDGAPLHPDGVFKTINQMATPDIVLICVKDYDLDGVLQLLRERIHQQTVLLPLMNGVDIFSKVKSVFPEHQVLPACVYVASHLKGPGVVEHKGKPGIIIAGEDPAFSKADHEWISQLFVTAGINFTLKPDAWEEIRTKFLFIAAFGLVTARFNKSIGNVVEDATLRQTARDLLQEYASILFGSDNIERRVENAFERAATFPYDTPTSLQLDVHSGKGPEKNELDLYLRPIIDAGSHENSIAYRLAGEIRAGLTA
mgnify:CR=1 FL=1